MSNVISYAVLFLLAAQYIQLSWSLCKGSMDAYSWVLLCTLVTLAWDALVVAMGLLAAPSSLLALLNRPRYWAHAVLTPTIIIVAFGGLRRAGLTWAQSTSAHAVVCLAALLLALLGAGPLVLRLDLAFDSSLRPPRYKSINAHGGAAIAVPIVTTVACLGMGISLWRTNGSMSLLLASVNVFVMNAAPGKCSFSTFLRFAHRSRSVCAGQRFRR
jgi:hypothetical protein